MPCLYGRSMRLHWSPPPDHKRCYSRIQIRNEYCHLIGFGIAPFSRLSRVEEDASFTCKDNCIAHLTPMQILKPLTVRQSTCTQFRQANNTPILSKAASRLAIMQMKYGGSSIYR